MNYLSQHVLSTIHNIHLCLFGKIFSLEHIDVVYCNNLIALVCTSNFDSVLSPSGTDNKIPSFLFILFFYLYCPLRGQIDPILDYNASRGKGVRIPGMAAANCARSIDTTHAVGVAHARSTQPPVPSCII